MGLDFMVQYMGLQNMMSPFRCVMSLFLYFLIFTVKLIHTGSGRLLGSNEISFSSDGTNATFRAMFKEPLEIQPNTNYTAVSTLKGLDSHYGTKGLRKVTVDCHNGGKVTFQFSYAAGNNNGTSVEDGQIPEIIFYT